jgi:hypothetical protein
MKNLSISIPKPCHEDWNNMTPEQRGRFCGKCSKTVFDFSNKNMDEAKEYLASHRNEKLCGRFRNNQLSQPITIRIPLQTSNVKLSPMQVFLMAALLAFGTTLFSCTTPQGETVGMLQIIDAGIENYPATTKSQNRLTGEIACKFPVNDTAEAGDVTQNSIVTGGVSVCVITVPEVGTVKGDTIVSYEAVTEPEDTLFETLPVAEIEETISPQPINCVTKGLIAIDIPITPASTFIDPGSETENNKEALPAPANDYNFISVYPNPTDGLLNLEISMEKEQPADADLYDLSGRHVSKLFIKKLLEPGRNSLRVDISGQPSGTYLLSIAAGNKRATEKVVIGKR